MTTLFRRREQRHLALFGAVVAICLFLLLLATHSGEWRISAPRLRIFQWPSQSKYAQESGHTCQKSVGQNSEVRPWEVETSAPMVPNGQNSNTKVGAHTWGFNVLDNLYLRNGTFYIVTSDRDNVPPKEEIIHRLGRFSTHGDQDDEGSEVSFASVCLRCLSLTLPQLVKYITPSQARDILGVFATVIPGVTFLVLDPPRYLAVSIRLSYYACTTQFPHKP